MYLSKIWFFLVAALAVVALTLALVMPRPAERVAIKDEGRRLSGACKIVEILLRDNARSRVGLVDKLSRLGSPTDSPSLRLDKILFDASQAEIIATKEHQTGKAALSNIVSSFERAGSTPPDFILLLDGRGRVVARYSTSGQDKDEFGDSMRGYHLVDDAVAGYIRDDLWTISGKLFRVAGAPVVTRDRTWAGAIIIGHGVTTDFTKSLAVGLDVSLSFYAAGDSVAASDAASIHKAVLAKAGDLEELKPGTDCLKGAPFTTTISGTTYSALSARLPGEAGALGAFYTVYLERGASLGFSGTLDAVDKRDLSLSNFPWIRVVLVFIFLVGVGMFLMIWESDKPLKNLAADAQRLSKGGDKLVEERHRGNFGSIARSVNIALDRLRREAKSAQKDLDDLLGPAPAAGGSPLPMMGPGPAVAAASKPPPPSEFRFSDAPAAPGLPTHSGGGAPVSRPTLRPGTNPNPMAPPNLDLPVPPPPAAMPAPPPAEHLVPPRPVALPGTPAMRTSPVASAPSVPQVPRVASALPAAFTPPVVAPIEPDEAETVIRGEPASRQVPMVENMETVVSAEPQRIAESDAETQHFREIFDKFLSTKRECGESADSLTYERFIAKLRKNRDALIAKHGCKSVRFQVYVKGGKAALKASPVR